MCAVVLALVGGGDGQEGEGRGRGQGQHRHHPAQPDHAGHPLLAPGLQPLLRLFSSNLLRPLLRQSLGCLQIVLKRQ